MHRWFLLAVAAVACGYPDRVEPDYGSELTDTVPQFRGQVPRNLIMISIDTLRKDHVDRYATDGVSTMPFLSYLADSGVALDDFTQCANWTFAATSCTLAGRTNEEAGMAVVLPEANRRPWPAGTPFLASHLDDAGFFSVLSTSNTFLSGTWGNAQGYDRWFHPQNGTALGGYRQARQMLDDRRRQTEVPRWFLHVHVTEPHAAYNPPPAYLDEVRALPPVPWDLADREEHYDQRDSYPALTDEDQALLEAHLRARYRADARWLDDQLFAIFQDLESSGLLDDALLVFWSDHGEAFWEHGWHTHAYTLHGEETDAIGILWAKNIVPQAITGPTASIDLAPTLAHLMTGVIPSAMTGLPLGTAPADRSRFAWAVARLGSWQSIEREGWKLMFRWGGGVRLYDRNTDPLEQTNLYDAADPHPMAVELWNALRPRVEMADPLLPNYEVQWPDELMPE